MKHVHAELMMQYAEDAMTTDKPWELWEIGLEGDWLPLDDVDKLWSLEYTYRRKPKTIRIGEYDSLSFTGTMTMTINGNEEVFDGSVEIRGA